MFIEWVTICYCNLSSYHTSFADRHITICKSMSSELTGKQSLSILRVVHQSLELKRYRCYFV